MNLPHADKAIVERGKVVDYLLAFDHPEGSSKAVFFSRFGFKVQEWRVLAEALTEHARRTQVIDATESRYGRKYVIEGPMACPNGREPIVRSVWIIDSGVDFPRLVSAYPV